MVRKLLIWTLVVFLSATTGAYMAKQQVVAPDNFEFSENNPIAISDMSGIVLQQLNSKRLESSASALLVDERLSKAAKARLATILAYNDYSGSKSALTRERAMEMVDYQPVTIGDVFFELNSINDDFINKLFSNNTEKETLLLPNFKDVGVAELSRESKSYYYLLLGEEKRKVSTKAVVRNTAKTVKSWGGPDLWEVVNTRRIDFGVGKLSRKDELCTIASIRLNQLLELKKLDGHAGFQPTLDRSDLKWIGEKYNVSEYLAQGFDTPQETVKGWENTLGHRSLLTGGEFVWGCIYAQNSFAVAITAY